MWLLAVPAKCIEVNRSQSTALVGLQCWHSKLLPSKQGVPCVVRSKRIVRRAVAVREWIDRGAGQVR